MKFRRPFRAFWRRQRLLMVGLAALAAVALFRLQFRTIVVSGESMLPTFCTGDLLLVSKGAYQATDPHRGDIVVARYRKQLIIKRVVGLPGEEVEVKEGALCINGAAVAEEYDLQRGDLAVGKGKLCQGKFALLGDNRDLLPTQCVHAVVSKKEIVGKVGFSIRWPHWHPASTADETIQTPDPIADGRDILLGARGLESR